MGQSQVIRHGSVFSAIFDLASGKFCFWGSGVTSPILCSISSTMGLGTGVAFAPMWDRTCPYSRLWMLRCNTHFKQLQGALDPTLSHPFELKSVPRRSGCYVVTPISSTSKTLWILHCNIHLKSGPRRSGCYVVTSI